jgi:hypothetical protein
MLMLGYHLIADGRKSDLLVLVVEDAGNLPPTFSLVISLLASSSLVLGFTLHSFGNQRPSSVRWLGLESL